MMEKVLKLRRRLSARRKVEVAAGLLLTLMAANLLSVIARKSITIDEASAIPAGYYHLTKGAFHINSEHPPVPKMLAALPLTLLDVEAPPIEERPGGDFAQRTIETAPRFWQANRARFLSIFFWARVPMILLTLALGALIFVFTRLLFNERAAILALALYTLEPTILAHGRIVKDVHVAFAYLLFVFAFYLYASAPGMRRALFLGFALGLAPVFKFSMGVAAPVFLVASAALVYLAPRRGLARSRAFVQLAAACVVAVVVINAAYFFSRDAVTAQDVEWLKRVVPTRAGALLSAINLLSLIFPPYFLFGLAAVPFKDAGARQFFLLGSFSEQGWWYYFPAAFALKTTLPFLFVSVAATLWSLREVFRRRELRFVVLLAPLAVYVALAATTSINIGVRHFVPALPFLFIMGGALLDRLLGAAHMRVAVRVAVALAFVWMAFEAARAYPHYIPYMNQLAARGERWQYLSDSNVEWGDDLGALARYLKARGETRVRAACLGGNVILPLYGVEYVGLLAPPGEVIPETRYTAIGASYLNGSTVPGWSEGSGRETREEQRNYFAAYRDRKPEAIFGHSIYLFREK